MLNTSRMGISVKFLWGNHEFTSYTNINFQNQIHRCRQLTLSQRRQKYCLQKCVVGLPGPVVRSRFVLEERNYKLEKQIKFCLFGQERFQKTLEFCCQQETLSKHQYHFQNRSQYIYLPTKNVYGTTYVRRLYLWN